MKKWIYEWLLDRCIVDVRSAIYYFKLTSELILCRPMFLWRRWRIAKLEKKLGFNKD